MTSRGPAAAGILPRADALSLVDAYLQADAASLDAGAAFEEARRSESAELTVAADEVLGSLVDGLIEVERMNSRAAGYRIQQVYQVLKYTELNTPVTTSDGMRPWSQAVTARRTAVAEVAAALRVPDCTAQNLLEEARMLAERLPATLTALCAGEFSYRHAKVIVAHARTLPEELHCDFETAVLAAASRLTASQFERKARTIRERMDPATIAERHRRSFVEREASFEPAPDGMGWLHLHSSATVTLAAWNRVDEMARQLAQSPDETRTLTQLRADVVADLLLDGSIDGRPEFSIRPTVTITVPVLAMLGVTHKNGRAAGKNQDGTNKGKQANDIAAGRVADLPILDGYGPIDIETATRLAGAAKSWLRVLTHPETGVILSIGRDRYKVPAPLRALLRHQDGTCRKPGCNRPAARCDLDHTEEWQHGGQTAHGNLAHLCQKHHDDKHHLNVGVKQLPSGDIEWTLPSGRVYVSEPENRFLGVHEVDPRDPAIPDVTATGKGTPDDVETRPGARDP